MISIACLFLTGNAAKKKKTFFPLNLHYTKWKYWLRWLYTLPKLPPQQIWHHRKKKVCVIAAITLVNKIKPKIFYINSCSTFTIQMHHQRKHGTWNVTHHNIVYNLHICWNPFISFLWHRFEMFHCQIGKNINRSLNYVKIWTRGPACIWIGKSLDRTRLTEQCVLVDFKDFFCFWINYTLNLTVIRTKFKQNEWFCVMIACWQQLEKLRETSLRRCERVTAGLRPPWKLPLDKDHGAPHFITQLLNWKCARLDLALDDHISIWGVKLYMHMKVWTKWGKGVGATGTIVVCRADFHAAGMEWVQVTKCPGCNFHSVSWNRLRAETIHPFSIAPHLFRVKENRSLFYPTSSKMWGTSWTGHISKQSPPLRMFF